MRVVVAVFSSWLDYAAWGGCSLLVWLVYALRAVRSPSMKVDVTLGPPLVLVVALGPITLGVVVVVVPVVLAVFVASEVLLWPTACALAFRI